MLAAAVIGTVLMLSPLPADRAWTTVLAPPFEQVQVGNLAYRADPPNIDIRRRPQATVANGGGDCEDLAIATYHSFRLAGTPADQVYILVGLLGSEGWHAVVAVRQGGGWRYVDPTGMIYRGNLRPLFMVNEQGSYLVTGTS